MRSLVIPLAVLSNACQFIGLQVVGVSSVLGTWRPPFFSSLAWHIATAMEYVVLIFIGAIIVEKLAKLFKGEATRERCYSLLAHSMIPGAAAGILTLVPSLSIFAFIFAILGGLFTLYNGTTKMTTVPESNKLFFTIALIISLMATARVVFYIGSLLIARPVAGLNVP